MHHIRNRNLFVIITILTVLYLFVTGVNFEGKSLLHLPSTSPTPAAAPPSPEVTTAASTAPASAISHCLDSQAISQVTGQTYQSQNEQFFPQDQLLVCTYRADQQQDNISPTLSYTLRATLSQAQALWQNQQTLDAISPAYRRIDQDPQLFANLNPVKELSQVTFYGFRNQLFLKLDYTPVKEEVGVELDKGTRLSELILDEATK